MIGNIIRRFDSLDSTSNYVATELMSGNYSEGDVILAHFQTAGRGQRESVWQSEPGSNLMMSFAIDITFLENSEQFLLSESISLGIKAYLNAEKLSGVWIKWPNDILVSDRKIGGMLIEIKRSNGKKWAVVGIGLNINQLEFSPELSATSLALEIGQKVMTMRVTKTVIEEINVWMDQLKAKNFNPIRTAYHDALYGYRSWIEFRDGDRRFTGKISHVDDDGHLWVRSKQGAINQYQPKQVEIIY